jgi:magnesium transporter
MNVDQPKRTMAQLSETARYHLAKNVPVAHAEDSVAAVISALPGRTYEVADAVYVLDDVGRLQGLVGLKELLGHVPESQLKDVMTHRPPAVLLGEDQERIALLAIRHSLATVPVVDETGRLLGVVPATELIRILRHEHVEDLHRLAGILAGQEQIQRAIEVSPVHRLRDRFPWLLVGLLGSSVATLVMARFEQVLEARIAVAFFIPAIVYLADAIGTQTEAIAVRFLSLHHAPLGRLLMGELWAGLLIGMSLGALILPAVWLGWGDMRLATAVALAVAGAGGCAATVGVIFPWLLSRAGKDPAYGSGPVATIVQDVLSLLIYLGAVSFFVV